MKSNILKSHTISYVEIYAPMAKLLAHWHVHTLGFQLIAQREDPAKNISSYVIKSNNICLVITATYPSNLSLGDPEIGKFLFTNYYGVKRFALQVNSVKDAFAHCISEGAAPVKFPTLSADENGEMSEASVKLYDHCEILFHDSQDYKGVFKPGYKEVSSKKPDTFFFTEIDHIASEVRINESILWTEYFSKILGTQFVQGINKSTENTTGLILKVSQSPDEKLTLVIAEPESFEYPNSKVQKNISTYGPGIHHLAFHTNDLIKTASELSSRGIEFVSFPPTYYDLLRNDSDFKDLNIDDLQKNGILIDKEGDGYLLQKFVRPIGDRSFFFYEIVQRVNGYEGFALKNINVLKRAEEIQIMKA